MAAPLNEADLADAAVAATDAGSERDSRSSGRGKLVARRFLRNRLAVAGLLVVVLFYLVAFTYTWYAPWAYDELDPAATLMPPDGTHWFGTNQIGGDMFAQTMRGLQKSLTIGLLAALFSTGVASIIGAAAGYFGGWTDRIAMWVVDLLLILPPFLIISILSPAFRGKTWLILVGLIAVFQWMITARIVRGMTLTLREREFVQAARFMGQSSWRIIVKHIVPNMASLLIIDATINVGAAIITETSLSFFGFGVQAPDVSLGTLISAGSDAVRTFPWLFYIPTGFLVATVLAVNFAGDGLRDALDPSSSRSRRKERKRIEEKTKSPSASTVGAQA
ncbi:peptide/nickel transport system permease protein [Amycolatopsis sulphurea]|uniref:Oligopeptide transport system permease protein OppC n=1 Tax=Amycolatopsis sulphurea TaxID=76022 RepID=A0A2A9G150_9PSEU|nr:ABC transporter permease [Amycolatopsis sulphurea]PFG56520.1 peptide/nickel transport system permease protein [Amycolatopsis sulphurea]